MPIKIPNALVEAAQRREVVLFAGAGISYATLKVGGLEIRDAIGALIRIDFPSYDFTKRSVEDVCDEYAALNDRVTLAFKLAELIPQNATPLESHVAAVQMFRFIVTTNWDLLFESAARQVGTNYHVLSENADAPAFNFDQHNLLKIHGSVDKPRSLVATSDDYENYPDTHRELLDKVSALLASNTVLFAGYGLRDEHLRRLLARIRHQSGDWARSAYAIGFYDEVRTEVLLKRGIKVLEYDAAEVLPELAMRAGFRPSASAAKQP